MKVGTTTSGVWKSNFWNASRRPVPGQPGQERVRAVTHLEAPVLAGHVVAHQLDLAHVADAQAALVRQADVLDAQRVEAHQLGGHGIDRDLIGRSQDDVLDHRLHQARAGAVARGRAVHDGEHAGMDLPLDRQQVHQRLVNPGVRVMPVFAQQPTEGVLHRAGGRRVHVRLDGRQMDDVLADEIIRDLDPLRVDVIQRQHRRLGPVGHPRHVFFAEIVQRRNVVTPEDRHVAVQIFALERVGDHRLVLHADQIVEARGAQRQDRAFELPRRRVGAGHREMPRDVILQDRRRVGRQRLRAAGQTQTARR